MKVIFPWVQSLNLLAQHTGNRLISKFINIFANFFIYLPILSFLVFYHWMSVSSVSKKYQIEDLSSTPKLKIDIKAVRKWIFEKIGRNLITILRLHTSKIGLQFLKKICIEKDMVQLRWYRWLQDQESSKRNP